MPATPLFLIAPMLLSAIALPASHASRGAQDAGETDIIRARNDAHDRMTVPVIIGARGPYRFLLDTGSQNTVLASSLASELALPARGRARLVGVGGELTVDTAEVDEIRLGTRSFYGLRAPLLLRADIGADGILGIDSLQDQRVLLDFRRGLIAVNDAKSLGGDGGYDIVVRARRRMGQLIMTDAVIDGVRTQVVIDTGSQVTIGNESLKRSLTRRRMQPQLATIDSVTGQSVTAEVGIARELTVDRLRIGNVAIAFTGAPAFRELGLEHRPALLLGMRELRGFRRVAIDFSTRKVLFELNGGV